MQRNYMWAPVTMVLLTINVLVFAATYMSEDGIRQYALVPQYITKNLTMFAMSSLISMFLHANIVHLMFNMLALFSLGRILEPHIGSARFAFVYILAGFAGSGLHTAYALIAGVGVNTPVVGASGAIFGVIGIAAALGDRLAFYWLIAQVPFAFGFAQFSPIAYFAHIGGFISGFASGRIMLYIKRRRGTMGTIHK